MCYARTTTCTRCHLPLEQFELCQLILDHESTVSPHSRRKSVLPTGIHGYKKTSKEYLRRRLLFGAAVVQLDAVDKRLHENWKVWDREDEVWEEEMERGGLGEGMEMLLRNWGDVRDVVIGREGGEMKGYGGSRYTQGHDLHNTTKTALHTTQTGAQSSLDSENLRTTSKINFDVLANKLCIPRRQNVDAATYLQTSLSALLALDDTLTQRDEQERCDLKQYKQLKARALRLGKQCDELEESLAQIPRWRVERGWPGHVIVERKVEDTVEERGVRCGHCEVVGREKGDGFELGVGC